MESIHLETLETYHEIADRLIATFGQSWMHDDKYKSILITNLVKSDTEYRSDRGTSRATYRFGGWKFAKMKMMNLRKREKHLVSLNYQNGPDQLYTLLPSNEEEPIEVAIGVENEEEKHVLVESILTHPALTEVEKMYLKLIYKDGLSHNTIAERLAVTKQAVSFTEQKALRKLRGIFNVKTS